MAHQKKHSVYFIGETEMNKYKRLELTTYKYKKHVICPSITCFNIVFVFIKISVISSIILSTVFSDKRNSF